jgi:hypothetical protein
MAGRAAAQAVSNMNQEEQTRHNVAVRMAKDHLKEARNNVRRALTVLECDNLTADKAGPLHTVMRRIDLWITRENNFEKQPSR